MLHLLAIIYYLKWLSMICLLQQTVILIAYTESDHICLVV